MILREECDGVEYAVAIIPGQDAGGDEIGGVHFHDDPPFVVEMPVTYILHGV